MISTRPARALDVVHFTKFYCPERFAGIVVEEDGMRIAAGIVLPLEGKAWLAMDITPRMREKKIALHRIGLKLVGAAVEAFGELYVMRDPREKGAKDWLERLGFRETGDLRRGEVVMRAGG